MPDASASGVYDADTALAVTGTSASGVYKADTALAVAVCVCVCIYIYMGRMCRVQAVYVWEEGVGTDSLHRQGEKGVECICIGRRCRN